MNYVIHYHTHTHTHTTVNSFCLVLYCIFTFVAVGLDDHPQMARAKDNFYTMSRPPTKGQYPQVS